MPSITPMISVTVREAVLISRMVRTTSDTTVPPCCATSEALSASWQAWPALSAFCRTIEVICSMLAAVCCSELACCSVRCDRSALPAAICRVAAEMAPEPWRTRCTVSASAPCMRARPSSRRPISSRRWWRTGCAGRRRRCGRTGRPPPPAGRRWPAAATRRTTRRPPAPSGWRPAPPSGSGRRPTGNRRSWPATAELQRRAPGWRRWPRGRSWRRSSPSGHRRWRGRRRAGRR